MGKLFADLAANLADFLVYLAIALVTVIGLMKCIIPVWKSARRLRRATGMLSANQSGTHPIWQDVMFLGKDMQLSWRRFLVNAEQLDARGLNCNVEDYVNDDTAIYAVGHAQLAEIIPSLLTSLGILGTFIGLMRGLGGLDVSDAAKTMESIPQMIGGMTFAFMTSIAGISCSLIFNMLNRMAVGTASRAIDDFNDAFTGQVMQKPLDDYVQLICQQEDRSTFLRQMTGDLGNRVSEGISNSVERTLIPVTQQMDRYVLAQTQTQIEGVNRIVSQFMAQMNQSLGGQFTQLGNTLSAVNQAQTVSYETMNRTMTAADDIIRSLSQVQQVTDQVMKRFDNYISTMERAQDSTGAFLTHGSQVLSGIMTASEEEAEFLEKLKASQQAMDKCLMEYKSQQNELLGAVSAQSQNTLEAATSITAHMDTSGLQLANSYTTFVENLTRGFDQSMQRFENAMTGVLGALEEKLNELKQPETEGCIKAASRLQQALTGLSEVLESKAGDKA